MNPSYFSIKLNMDEAVKRLCDWTKADYKERIETGYSKAVDVSLDKDGKWKGASLYVYENEGWTVFEDLSGGYSFIEPEEWKKFAQKDEFVLAGYNDAILYAEMVVITDGVVTKHFIEDNDNPEDNINEGDGVEDIKNWVNVASFVDDDDIVYSEEGVVLIF